MEQMSISLPQREVTLSEIENNRERTNTFVSRRNQLLAELVERVRNLEGVFIPTVERRLRDGTIVTLTGSWQYQRSPEDMANHHFASFSEFGNSHFLGDDHALEMESSENFDVGGQCIVSQVVFNESIEKGWAIPHPFAGYYHPILKVYIPSTMIHFRAPKSQDDIEALWKIIQHSYEWVHSHDVLEEERLHSESQ